MTDWFQCATCGKTVDEFQYKEYRHMKTTSYGVCFDCEIKGIRRKGMYFRIFLCSVLICLAIVLFVCQQVFGYDLPLPIPGSKPVSEVEKVRRIATKYDAEVEVILWDRTRVDLLNDEYAIEVDWAEGKFEAIGQSLYYSIVTGRKPGIILLVKDMERERRHIYRCQTVCAKYDIKLWIEKVEAQ